MYWEGKLHSSKQHSNRPPHHNTQLKKRSTMYLLFKTLAPRATPASAFATLALALCLIIAFDSLLSFNLHRSVHRYARENRSGFLVDGSLTDVERAILLGHEIQDMIEELEQEEYNNKGIRLGNDGGRIWRR